MTERGAKPMALPAVTHLVTGCAQVLSVAQTLATLPHPASSDAPASVPLESVRSAERQVAVAFNSVQLWFEALALALAGRHSETPAIAPVGEGGYPEVLAAVEEAGSARRPDQMVAALRLLWLSERLMDLHRLQVELLESMDRIVGTGLLG
jgi:hypothetical protein